MCERHLAQSGSSQERQLEKQVQSILNTIIILVSRENIVISRIIVVSLYQGIKKIGKRQTYC